MQYVNQYMCIYIYICISILYIYGHTHIVHIQVRYEPCTESLTSITLQNVKRKPPKWDGRRCTGLMAFKGKLDDIWWYATWPLEKAMLGWSSHLDTFSKYLATMIGFTLLHGSLIGFALGMRGPEALALVFLRLPPSASCKRRARKWLATCIAP